MNGAELFQHPKHDPWEGQWAEELRRRDAVTPDMDPDMDAVRAFLMVTAERSTDGGGEC